MDGKSLDITAARLEQLQQLFPEVFAEGQVDFEKLKLVLGAANLAPEERYELSWAGKHDAFKEIQKQTTATLIPNKENSINFDRSENIFIEGENLEALRVLQKSYYGKIKMIYIDPPYNTGNDSFVYPDDYTERRIAYEKRTGIKDEEGFLNKQDLWKKNTKENGQFHSVWLSMLYPRLFLARNLLKEDGVIFVSIDDNELNNLRSLMDMVFGEENFVANLVWQKRVSPANDSKWFSSDHEYLLVYTKTKENWYPNRTKRNEKHNSYYKNPDNDPRGAWNSAAYTCNKSRGERPNLYYGITNPNTNKTIYPSEDAVWAYSKETHEQHVKDNLLYWGKEGTSKSPRKKQFLTEAQKVVPRSVWHYKEVGSTQKATMEIRALFEKGVFSYPKSVELLKKAVYHSTNKEKTDIVLDFFTGSGTLAQAVMQLNQEDGGNRKFICIQLPEATPANSEAQKAGYETISQISQARIQKVIEKIKEEEVGQLDFNKDTPQDLGFKSFTLAPSNFKVWQSDAQGDALAEQLDIFQSPYKEGAEQENMLYELLLKAGYPLTVAIQKTTIANHVVYHVDGGHLLLALEAVNEAILAHVLATQPQRFIALDQLFGQDDSLLTNTRSQLQEAGIDFQVI